MILYPDPIFIEWWVRERSRVQSTIALGGSVHIQYLWYCRRERPARPLQSVLLDARDQVASVFDHPDVSDRFQHCLIHPIRGIELLSTQESNTLILITGSAQMVRTDWKSRKLNHFDLWCIRERSGAVLRAVPAVVQKVLHMNRSPQTWARLRSRTHFPKFYIFSPKARRRRKFWVFYIIVYRFPMGFGAVLNELLQISGILRKFPDFFLKFSSKVRKIPGNKT